MFAMSLTEYFFSIGIMQLSRRAPGMPGTTGGTSRRRHLSPSGKDRVIRTDSKFVIVNTVSVFAVLQENVRYGNE